MSLAEAFSVIVDPQSSGAQHARSGGNAGGSGMRDAVRGRQFRGDRTCGPRRGWSGWRRFMKLEHGIASHDTLGRVLGLLDAQAVERSFRQWVSGPDPGAGGRHSGGRGWQDQPAQRGRGAGAAASGQRAWPLASGWCWDKRPPARKSNELTPRYRRCCKRWRYAGSSSPSMPWAPMPLLPRLIQEQGADYVLAVKDNQPYLAEIDARVLRHRTGQ